MCAFTNSLANRMARGRDEQGVALITALALLVIFSLMGAAYLGYMLNDRSAVAADINRGRVQQAAEAGIYAAIGNLQKQIASGGTPPTSLELSFPAYFANLETGDDPLDIRAASLEPRDDIELTAAVTISDENARININFAPRGMLERILNIDRATARRITSDLPRSGESADASKRWFTSVDDLVTRGYLTPQAFNQLDKNLLTVYTGDDLTTPRHYINLNTAPAPVVAAVLNVPDDRALAIAQGPPLNTIQDLASAAGQDPSAFNTVPEAGASPAALPSELTLQSRTFRLVSKAALLKQGRQTVTERIEAVVHIPNEGRPEIRYWSVETRGSDAVTPAVEPEAELVETVDEPLLDDVPETESIEPDSADTETSEPNINQPVI